MSERVNRSLADKHFDHIDHALGRPLKPKGNTYRNYFAIGTDNDLAEEFRASPHWKEGGSHGDTTYFQVTYEGRLALAEHLRQIGDPHKAFAVMWEGYTSTVVAKTRSEARYIAYLSASDAFDLKFKDFQKTASVRSA